MCRLIVLVLTLAISHTLFSVDSLSAKETDGDVPLAGISSSLQPDLFTGTLTGRIPIEVQPGRNGMQPNLALTYVSSGGNGWLGIGWKLEMGVIERQTRWGVLYNPTAAEEQAGKVYTFHLNGVSADLVQSLPPAPSNQYQMKIEGNFFRVLKLAGNGWEVTDRQGRKYLFGMSNQTRIADPGDPNKVFKWCLERVEDRDGNYMTLTYTGDQGQGYLSQINYTGNGATTPTNTVKFYLEDRPDAADLYTSNFKIKTAKRLKTIEIKANGALVRAYKVTYSTSAATSASLFSSVQQYGKDATINVSGTITAGSALPQTTLGYRTDASGASFTNGSTWITGWCPSGTTYGTADFNGDGKQDLWCKSGSAQYGALSNGLGGFTDGGGWNFVNTGWCNDLMNPTDLDGNGTDNQWCWNSGWHFFNPDDPSSNIIHYLSWLKHPNTVLFTTDSLDGYQYQFWQTTEAERPGSADFNGDGKADAFFFDGSKLHYFFGTGTSLTYVGSVGGFCSSSSNGAFDFNGDGMADLWCHTGGTTTTLLSTGNGFVTGPSMTNWCASGAFGVGEFNGDGKPDFYCHPTDGTTQIVLSTGSVFTNPTTWLTNWCATDQFGLGDFNGDGKRDLWCHPTDGTTQVALSTGSAFTAAGTWLSNWCVTGTFGVGDFTGDGKQDLYCHQSGQVLVARSGSVLGPLDLLASVYDGVGGTTTISYLPSTSYANTQLPFPMQTVTDIATNDGNGTISTTTYLYSGGFFHVTEKDFRGFNYVKVTSPAGLNGAQSLSETWFHQGNDLTVDTNNPNVPTGYTKGLPYRTKVARVGSPNVSLAETTTTYKADIDGIAPWFTPSGVVTTSIFDSAGVLAKQTQTESVSYDAYGNVILAYNRGDATNNNAVANDDTTTAMIFGNYDTTNWLLAFPTVQTMYAGMGTTGTKLSEIKYFYDGASSCTAPSGNLIPTKGHVTKVERWLNGGTNPVIGMAYNNYGSATCTRDPKGNTTNLAYDPTSTFPLTSTNALGHVTTSTYYGVNGVAMDTGLYGQVKSVTDSNGRTVISTYDALGRNLATTTPDGLVSTMAYNYGGTFVVGTQNIQSTTSGGGLTTNLVTKTYFDGLGRTTKKESPGAADGGGALKVLVTETQYDARGLVKQSSLPYIQGTESATGRWSTMTYDALGRPIQSTNPDNTSSRICYNGWATTTLDPKLHKKVETNDAFGRVITVQEYTGQATAGTCAGGTLYATTTYQYDLLGNLSSVTDAKGNISTMTYDTLSRKLTMHDPDMGNWSYTYDANGNLLTQVDAKNQKLCFTYDVLNRRTQKNYGATTVACGTNTVVYAYDDTVTTYNRKGRLKQVTDPAQSVTFQYDNRGRITQSAKTLDGTTYTTTSVYDGLGRLTTVSYPTNPIKTVTYTYDGPQLKRVSEGATNYVTYAGWNALGQAATATFANGVVTTSTYANTNNATCTQQTFRLCTLKTQKGATPFYQHLRYDYELNGNVWNIYDATVASNLGDQHFSYDDLDRLTLANGPYGASGANASFPYSYDQIGNMSVNPQVGAYSYPASGPSSVRPHAVSVAGPYPVSYDNNGNVTTMTDPTGFYGYSASSDAENRLSSVTTTYGGVPTTATFVYDGDGGRVKKIVGTTTIRYISKLYECDTTGGTTSCARFIWAGNTRIATAGGNGAVHYWHGDHLGSSSVITDSTGAKVQALTYFPYGDIASNVPGSPVNVPYKYTGQELDASSNLYFYESRYYHPVFGRFVSPDTIVPNPRDPQDLNRYSYVRNNPLRYTDPTGYEPCSHVKQGYCEGGYGFYQDDYDFAFGAIATGPVYITASPSPPLANSWGSAFSPSLFGIFPGGSTMPEVTAGPVVMTAPRIAPSLPYYPLGYANDAISSDVFFGNVDDLFPFSGTAKLFGKSAFALGTLLANPRGALLDAATHSRLKDAISNLFRSNAKIGSGSSMDAFRFEQATGELLSKTGHGQKLVERRSQLIDIMHDPALSPSDKAIAKGLLIDIQKALSGQ